MQFIFFCDFINLYVGGGSLTNDGILRLLDTDGNQRKILQLPSNNKTRGAFNPIIASIHNSGKCLRLDRDFNEGTEVNIRLVDKTVQNSLKPSHFVKFNRGSFMKLYEYTGIMLVIFYLIVLSIFLTNICY